MPAPRTRTLRFVLLSLLATAGQAYAQITGGPPLTIAAGVIDRNNAAYDSVNDVYLVIVQRPPVVGRFLNKNGVQVGSDFQISLEPGDPFAAWVSIAFGGPPNDPTFLVTYTIADDVVNPKYARFVRYVPGGAPTVSAPIFIANAGDQWYASEKAQNFWNGTDWLVGTRVLPLGASVPSPRVDRLTTGGVITGTQVLGDGVDYYASPSLTCAANGTCVVVGFKAGLPTFTGGTYARLFNGATLAPQGGMLDVASLNANEDQGVVYQTHTGRFLVAWFRGGGACCLVDTRLIDTDGSMSTLDLARGIGAPDAGTAAISFNPATHSTLLVTKSVGASLVVLELGDDGYPKDINNKVLITNWDGSVPDYLPSVAANADDGQWLVTAKLAAGPTGKIIQGTLLNDLVQNGTFGAGMASWSTFATPTPQDLVTSITNGVLSFYRQTLPPGTTGQGVVLQPLNVGVPAGTTLSAVFDLGNSSTVRKRITILLHDLDFSDLFVCSFWLAPAAPMRSYRMNTHTNRVWDNATISFYAATTGSNGGAYMLDNVHAYVTSGQSVDRTDCVDPTTPAPLQQADGANLVANGDFSTGLSPWGTFGQITFQIAGGVFEFFRPAGTPAGVVLQPTGVGLPLQSRLTLTLSLGNSSGVLKRVTVLLHDNDFSDLSACTFWLEPGQALGQHTMKTFTTKAWTNATVAVYGANVDTAQWARLDDVTLKVTPGASLLGTECIEPPGTENPPTGFVPGGVSTARRAASSGSASAGAEAMREIAPGDGAHVLFWSAPIDLRDANEAAIRFDSRLAGASSSAFVEVTADGRNWTRLAEIPPSDDWTGVSVDLSAFAGEVIYLRFVATGGWSIAHLSVETRPPQTPRFRLLRFR